MITPYEITATRLHARDAAKKEEKLLLASLNMDTPIDLLDVLEANVLTAEPAVTKDKSKSVSCVAVEREDDDTLSMVFATDLTGEREIMFDSEDPGRPFVFEKAKKHVARFYSVCLIHRARDAKTATMLLHSPWGRGGGKGQVITVLQRATSKDPLAKAKLEAHAMIPNSALAHLLQQAKATRITYRKTTGITSNFDQSSGSTSTPAEMGLTVKGDGSIPYRDALTAALRAATNRDKFFVVKVPNAAGVMEDQTFDDVEIDLKGADGTTRLYSIRHDTVPTMGYSKTTEINDLYWQLPATNYGAWPEQLRIGTKDLLAAILADVLTT